MIPDKGGVDHRGRSPLLGPAPDFLFVRIDAGFLDRFGPMTFEYLAEGAVLGHWRLEVEPTLCYGDLANLGCLVASHEPGVGYGAQGLPLTQLNNDLTILVHLKPPVGHVFLLILG